MAKKTSILTALRNEHGFEALGYAIDLADWRTHGCYVTGQSEDGGYATSTERPEDPPTFLSWLFSKDGMRALRQEIWKRIPHKHVWSAPEEGGSAESGAYLDSWCKRCGEHHRAWY